MEAGSGGRNEPYFRVSIDGKGSLTHLMVKYPMIEALHILI